MLYSIYIDNDGDGLPEIAYVFTFVTKLRNPDTFLYNTGPITSLDSNNWNKRQFYSVTRVEGDDTTTYGAGGPGLKTTVLGTDLACPPCNIGPRSTPDYPALGQAAVHTLRDGSIVFAGQRLEGFYVDLGAIFDLGDLRPFQHLHLIPSADAMGVDATKTLNVHTIALQVPISKLSANGSVPTDPMRGGAVIGVWASASRRKARVIEPGIDEAGVHSGPWVQGSRLGNPLFNEVIVPLGRKNFWNRQFPAGDKRFAKYVEQRELATLLPVLATPRRSGGLAYSRASCVPPGGPAVPAPGGVATGSTWSDSTSSSTRRCASLAPGGSTLVPVVRIRTRGPPRRYTATGNAPAASRTAYAHRATVSSSR